MTTRHPSRASKPARHRRWIAGVVCAGLAITIGAARHPLAAQAPSAARSRNFDARPGAAGSLLPAPQVVRAPNPALEAFSAGRPELAVTADGTTGVTTKLYDRLGYLTPPDPRTPSVIALDFIQTNLAVLGLNQADLAEYEVRDLVTNPATGSTHLYLRQMFQGIPVYNGLLHVNINRDGQILSVNNAWIRDLAVAANVAAPGLTAGEAVSRAAVALELESVTPPRSLGPAEGPKQRTPLDPTGISIEPLTAELMWMPIAAGDVRLVWDFQVYTADREHAFDLTVDASTGDLWTRFDWVAGDSYRVYEAPAESPIHVSPVPPADGRTLVTDPANATASPFGWHDTNGVAGAEFTGMRGNNVHAYDDINSNNLPPSAEVPPVAEPDCGVTLACDFAIDLAQAPSQYIPAAVANLFYWNNYIHDVQYQYGFTETGGNFQVNNYGRGGAGGDYVRAEAQDGGGTNNANFFTPRDGARPRMQMFLWTAANPDIDGDFDNGIIVHEYGHGISNRLVGGPASVSCLNNLQQPGEGLSDWWALAYTAKTGDAGTDGRGIGTYALNQPVTGAGIRTQRYSTSGAINTWTYASINGMAVPHGVGSVWAQAAWEMYWALVDAHGFSADLLNGSGTAGNQRAMLYVNEGLMNTSCSPAFTDVRDGIIQAATDNHGGADVCLLWTAFAGIGLGSDAVSGGSGSTSPTDGFGLPSACLVGAPTISINDVTITEGDSATLAGATGGFNVTLSATSGASISVDYATAEGTATASTSTLSNTAPLTLPASGTGGAAPAGAAGPYPSAVTVPATTPATTVSDANVTLTGFNHTWPADIDVLLQGPTGATVLLMSDVGGGTDAVNVDLTFDDEAAGTATSPVTTGTFRPTNLAGNDGATDVFPSPVPAGTPGTALSVFDGTNPAGVWNLYLRDDASADVGTLTGGWSLTLTTPAAGADFQPTSGTLTFTAGTTSQPVNVTVLGDVVSESNETFFVNLTSSVNATILDAQGVGTIIDDDDPGGGGGGWTDGTLSATVSVVRAVHINELRTRVNAARTANGLGPFLWSDSTLQVGVNVIKAVHVADLRTALTQVYTQLGQPAPVFTDPALTAGMTVIKVVHISQLRAAVFAVE